MILLVALAAACRYPEGRRIAGAWNRFDLLSVPPRVELAPAAGGQGAAYAQRSAFLGAEEVRDPTVVPKWNLKRVPAVSAGRIRALEQAAGSRLVWEVTLGGEPYFSFVPLAEAGDPVRCEYRVAVRTNPGRPEVVSRIEGGGTAAIAPRRVEVDLARWAGRRIELVLELGAAPEGSPSLRALWGSPGLFSRTPVRRAAGTRERPNVLLLAADTLRADALGAYGRRPSLTPALDRLAAESDVWLRAFSCFNTTNPSFASLLTGLYGKNHGVYDLKTSLPEEHTTLGNLFQEAGYETWALISAGHLGARINKGFDRLMAPPGQFAAEFAIDTAMDWIAQQQRPFFLWIHLFDPHTPHTPPQPFADGYRPQTAAGLSRVTSWVPFRPPGPRPYAEPRLGGHFDLYAGEVAYLDRQIDRLLGFLDSRGLLETTLIAFVADHGENLEDHGVRYRHAGLWDSTTHVPLMIRWPGASRPGRTFDVLVQHLDLFPTLLAAAGIEVPPQDGVDLRRLSAGLRHGRRLVFAEHADGNGSMVRSSAYKYMRLAASPFVAGGAYLYDLRVDPGEARNLAGAGLAVEEELARILERWEATRRRRAPARGEELSPQEEDQLQALGYL